MRIPMPLILAAAVVFTAVTVVINLNVAPFPIVNDFQGQSIVYTIPANGTFTLKSTAPKVTITSNNTITLYYIDVFYVVMITNATALNKLPNNAAFSIYYNGHDIKFIKDANLGPVITIGQSAFTYASFGRIGFKLNYANNYTYTAVTANVGNVATADGSPVVYGVTVYANGTVAFTDSGGNVIAKAQAKLVGSGTSFRIVNTRPLTFELQYNEVKVPMAIAPWRVYIIVAGNKPTSVTVTTGT